MKILQITAHLGGGVGKAVAGIIKLSPDDCETKVALLDVPNDLKWVDKAKDYGCEVLPYEERLLSWADIIVFNWWDCKTVNDFLKDFKKPDIPLVAWLHNNCFYPPIDDFAILPLADGFFFTTPLSFEHPHVGKKGILVYGYGDFRPEKIVPKVDYALKDTFNIGYCGTPSFKKLRPDCMDYYKSVLEVIPNAIFTFVGDTNDEFKDALFEAGIADKCRVLGKLTDCIEEIRNFDVCGFLISDTTFAATENALFETMAMGIPSLMPTKPLGKYFKGAIKVNSPAEFAKEVLKLYQSETLRKQIGESGREWVLKEVNADKTASMFYDTLKGMVK